jgi:hypothetical protein
LELKVAPGYMYIVDCAGLHESPTNRNSCLVVGCTCGSNIGPYFLAFATLELELIARDIFTSEKDNIGASGAILPYLGTRVLLSRPETVECDPSPKR